MLGSMIKTFAIAMLAYLTLYNGVQIPSQFFVIYGFGCYITLNRIKWLKKEEHDQHRFWLEKHMNEEHKDAKQKEIKNHYHHKHHHRRLEHFKWCIYSQYINMIVCAVVVIKQLQKQ